MDKINHTPRPFERQHYTSHVGFSIWGKGHGCIAERWYEKERPELSVNGNSELFQIADHAPHACDVPGCPGDLNRRKLELWDEMLAALDGTKQLLLECGWAVSASPTKQETYEALKRVIAKAKELK